MLHLANYDLQTDLRLDREDTQHGIGGGLLVYAKTGTKILCVDKPASCSRFNQFCCFEILDNEKTCTVYLVYRPPSSSAENGNWLAEMVNSCPTNTLMIGDFNLPGINWKNLTSDTGKGAQFLDACTERGLNQLVHFPTHNKGNILDLVLSDTPDSVHSVASHGRLGRSDHDMIVVRINVGKRQKKLPELTKNWRKADWEKMKYEMGQRDWQGEMAELGTEEAWQLFKTTVHGLVACALTSNPGQWQTPMANHSTSAGDPAKKENLGKIQEKPHTGKQGPVH